MDNILEKVYKAGPKFLEPLTLDETYRVIVNEAIKLVKAKYGSIMLMQNGSFKRAYASSPILYRIKPRKRGYAYKVFSTHRPTILTRAQNVKIHPEYKELKASADIMIPLSYKNKSIGVLTVQSEKEEHFTDKEFSILKLFGHFASLAIRKAQLQEETKKAVEVRDLFIALAAHELRTPLTTLNGYIQLLENRFSKKVSSEASWVRELSRESIRLTHLIQELLEINRMHSGTFHYIFKETSLTEIIRRAMINFSFSFPERKLILKKKPRQGYTIVGDSEKLIQVLNNILGNAAKFSPQQIPIALNLSSDSSSYIIKIKDRGHGIPKGEQIKIFKLFHKGSNNTQDGLGVGLFLAKTIIVQHHGSITVKSALTKGTTIEIRLPKLKT
ncbi:GAF domain-containing sensor histidine kinase [Candidatus Daviesbacteria bacterium]|nr:GAF domain-containing sensor histidine kinase [Candidatus Daviesbacteria bacterium]